MTKEVLPPESEGRDRQPEAFFMYKFSSINTAGCVMDFRDSIVAWMVLGLSLRLSSLGMDSGGQVFSQFALRV